MTDKNLDKIKVVLNYYKDIGVDFLQGSDLINLDLTKGVNMEVIDNKGVQKEKDKQELRETDSNKFSLISEIADPVSYARMLAEKANNIIELKEILLAFDGCDLKKLATNTVFGEGAKNPKIVFLGEAPGANEDLQGRPFCGESGKLLEIMLSYVDISRDKNAYITNSVFWRPPGNRRPTSEEIEICRPFVERHIAFLNPSLLVCVGSTATACLFNSSDNMSALRGKFKKYHNKYLQDPIDCFTIFHPAYLLRQPSQKKAVWFDLLEIKKYLSA